MERLYGKAIWQAPEPGTFIFYAIVTTGAVSMPLHINAPWNTATSTADYEYGYVHLSAHVQNTTGYSFTQFNTNTLFTAAVAPVMTGAMQTIITAVAPSIVANFTLTLTAGQLVQIEARFPFESSSLAVRVCSRRGSVLQSAAV
jgi:hypothetical protein